MTSARRESLIVLAVLGTAGLINVSFWLLIGYGLWRAF